MFKNVTLYRIAHWNPPSMDELEARLQAARFVECAATQTESSGWVEPRGAAHGPLLETIGGEWILQLCMETRAVPGAIVRSRLDERLARIESETGRRPRGKQSKELKEEIVHELLPRAFPKRSTALVWIDRERQCVVVGVGSQKRADAIASRLVELLGGGIALTLLQTGVAPATAMGGWLREKEAPPGFSVDRECELMQPDSEKATVRYARHTLDIDEVATHVEAGKVPTQLAMTWNGRVSFVLTDALCIRKIALQDVVLEGASTAGAANAGFDADVAIATGELGPLLQELVAALGGELDPNAASAVPGAALPAAGAPATPRAVAALPAETAPA